ncbi:glycosyltransferase [Planctomyces sp. SH-PL62]|uniref:glycosyltransferase n=1 Tax=Planctomyces sp. SH-PL62 TaxID=1636152 RepID=UPI00078BB876|nr:glycosyltransferase [Planctomyces sp. SH-PL62]AMV39218.1 Putative teichuronic acid biosynthesis glycosyltransferase TuaH [Planctomyces sp. SH-PL62]
MNNGTTIICLANNFFFDPTSKHHVMRELAKSQHVLWINWHASRRPSLNRRDLGSIVEKLSQFRRGVVKVQERLWVLTPLVVPLPSSILARKFNRWLIGLQTRWILRGLSPHRQLWSFTADVGPLLGAFGESRVIYYCVDEFAAFTGYDVETTKRLDRELCQAADLVITTSQNLFESRRLFNPDTVYVPHGVLYQHFAQALDPSFPVAEDLKALPGPIIGYYGLVQDWQDLDLLGEIARRRPDWSIVLVGKVQTDIQRFHTIKNLHFLGQRDHSVLPHYSRGFDVAMIPHKITELTLSMNPIKLREYLAAGLPVVSSPLPEVRAYEPEVRIAEDLEGWIAQLELAISARSLESDRRRSELVAGEDWSVRVKSILDLLERCQSDVHRGESVPSALRKTTE